MNFSGEFDAHFINTINSFDQNMFNIGKTLYIQTEQRVTPQGIHPPEVLMVKYPRDTGRIVRDFYPRTIEKIAAIYWQNGINIF
jgi:hypothetical protein